MGKIIASRMCFVCDHLITPDMEPHNHNEQPTTPPKSTPEGVAEILDAAGIRSGRDPLWSDSSITELIQALHDLYTQRFREAIGAEENPGQTTEYWQPFKIRNNFRAEAIKRWDELSKGGV